MRALVISGPNTGGKTVALKTIGLAALLHQSGLRPPAEVAALPVFDQVLADIGDRQSIEMSLSTFSAHLSALVSILESASERSLVLLDELAAGTDPEEGSALAQALLDRLVRQARLTVVTTHYAELKEWASAAARRSTAPPASTPRPTSRSTASRSAVRAPRTRCASRSGSGSTAPSSPTRATRVAPERLRTAELLAEAEAAEREAASLRERSSRTRCAPRAAREAELEREHGQGSGVGRPRAAGGGGRRRA